MYTFKALHFGGTVPPSKWKKAFSFLELVLTLALVGMGVVLSLSVLLYIRFQASAERERGYVEQLLTDEMERLRGTFYADLRPVNREVVIWDGGTPDDPEDDLKGTLEVILHDSRGAKLLRGPVNPGFVQAEVTITWHRRGNEMHDTLMTYLAP